MKPNNQKQSSQRRIVLLGLLACFSGSTQAVHSQSSIQNKLRAVTQQQDQLTDIALLQTEASIKNGINQQYIGQGQYTVEMLAQMNQQQLLQIYQTEEPIDQIASQIGAQDIEAVPESQQQVATGEIETAAAPEGTQQITQVQEAQPQAGEVQAEQQVQVSADAQTLADQQAVQQALAQQQAEAQLAKQGTRRIQPIRKANVQVAATADVNQAAAVAAAANQLFPDEKPFAKMNKLEKQVYLAKKQKEKQAKAAKDALENPTVDENGEHITTVAEAKVEARQLQEMLVAGEAAVDQKIAQEQQELAAMPANPEPVKQEEDDGHIETVEEVKLKMAAAQAAMDQGLAETDKRVEQMSAEGSSGGDGSMPNFGALADLHGSISNMGKMRKVKQLQDLAQKLGVEIQAGEEEMEASDLTNTLIQRAKQTGKSEAEINAALME